MTKFWYDTVWYKFQLTICTSRVWIAMLNVYCDWCQSNLQVCESIINNFIRLKHTCDECLCCLLPFAIDVNLIFRLQECECMFTDNCNWCNFIVVCYLRKNDLEELCFYLKEWNTHFIWWTILAKEKVSMISTTQQCSVAMSPLGKHQVHPSV